jgi:hypothetical protein
MGRSWQFLAVVAIIVGMGMVLYYRSDFYAERAAGGPAFEAQRTAVPVESVTAPGPAEDAAVAPAEAPPAEEAPAAPAQAGAAAP